MLVQQDDYLAHYGILRKSGRYPWGSGGTQSARNKTFLDTIEGLRKDGLSEVEIARGFSTDADPFTTTQLRALKSIAANQQKQEKINQAQRLKDKGMSNIAIGKQMGINESSVRSLLAPGAKDKADVLTATSEMLKSQIEKKKYLDVGTGAEASLPLSDGGNVGISETKFKTAVAVLQEQGYKLHYVKVPQLGTKNQTTLKVLTKPGVPYKEVYANRGQIKQITDFSEDGGRTYFGIQDPLVISSKRVKVNYAEDGGTAADGVIYVRPGVKDVSIGASRYAQVRIAVDGTHYLKGMAMYKDDLPEGTDLVFNTNKKKSGNKLDAMKALKDDPDNPFGAVIRQQFEVGPDGKERVSSAMNIVNTEGDWDKWSRSLPSQMLSKQSPKLAQQQLDVTYERKVRELNDIKSLTNPAVRRKLLDSYADDVDASAVHLAAAAIPKSSFHVILPIASMKDHEIYAPNFRDGDRVALVRFPHGGTFEIPELTVNNRNRAAKALIGSSAKDAIGINSKVAERLSGADFDGDSVIVIPNNKGLIKSTPALSGLRDFDPKASFPAYDGMQTIDGGVYKAASKSVDYTNRKHNSKQREMGNVTNLIADMTVHGANTEELARAVRHSMVVIDAEKHVLDHKGSARANGIAQLKTKYQRPSGRGRGGASTLITRATAEVSVPKRTPRRAKDGGPIDMATGRKVFVNTGKTYVNAKGKEVPESFRSKKLAETEDAHTLKSTPEGTRIENVYADHSNRLKALANEARKESYSTKPMKYNKSSKAVYSKEVDSLNAQLNIAIRNRPLERQAQVLAGAVVAAKKQANPNMDAAEEKKIKNQALSEMRLRTGAKRLQIKPTQEEWNAIQAGAISESKLKDILKVSDLDRVRELATPREKIKMTPSANARATSMLASGYTQAEVADQLGVSLSTLKVSLKGGETDG